MAQVVDGRADRLGNRLDEIDVFRVARWWSQIELEECGSSSKGESSDKAVVGEDLSQGTADDQILFHL